jgi:uncharacterized membrane protein YoaK (UPF0700 family)
MARAVAAAWSCERIIAKEDAVTNRTLPFLLSVVAGSTDTICFLGLNGLFTAHITGNVVVLAANIVTGKPAFISYLISVPVFMIVLYVARVLAIGLERIGIEPLRPLLLLQLLCLVACLELCVFAGPWADPQAVAAIVAGMMGVSAMAVQNALAQIGLKNVPSTAVMTTNVTHFILDVSDLAHLRDPALQGAARERALRTLPVIAGFVIGCALGALYQAAAGLWSLSLPTGLAVLALILV